MDNIEKSMTEQNQTDDRGYVLISEHYNADAKHTLLKIGCYLLAALNLVASFVIIGFCVFYTGMISIIYAFGYTSRRVSDAFSISILHVALFTAASVTWLVMTGYFIRSLIMKKRIRGPRILCNQMLHTSAIWIIVLRAILGSAICALALTDILETVYIYGFVALLIEFALNLIFMLCYYWYAVKLDFGLISDEAGEIASTQSFDVCNEKTRPICVDQSGLWVGPAIVSS